MKNELGVCVDNADGMESELNRFIPLPEAVTPILGFNLVKFIRADGIMAVIRARTVYPAKTPQPNSPPRLQVPAPQKNSATNTVVAVMYPTNYMTNFAMWP